MVNAVRFYLPWTQPSMWRVPFVLNFSTDVEENDIVGVTLPPSAMQLTFSQMQVFSEHIPILMNAPQSCFIRGNMQNCFVSAPLIKANFTPSPGKSYS